MKKLTIVLFLLILVQFSNAQCPDFSVGNVMAKAEGSWSDFVGEKITEAALKKIIGKLAFKLLDPSDLSSDADKPGLYTLKEGTIEYQDAFAKLNYSKMKASIKKMEKGLSQAKYNKNMPSNCYSKWKSVISDYKDFANGVYEERSLLY